MRGKLGNPKVGERNPIPGFPLHTTSITTIHSTTRLAFPFPVFGGFLLSMPRKVADQGFGLAI
jgi:hypothetical protein